MSGRESERGQAIMLYAILIPLSVLFALGIMDYMVTNVRAMATFAAADLAAHAGAQMVRLQPDGRILPHPHAETTVATYFDLQAPEEAILGAVNCGLLNTRPTCRLTASVESAGFLLPKAWIRVDAVGVLAYGATRPDQ